MTSSYYVDLTDPFADRLAALGLQRILADLLALQGDPTDGIRFVDCGGYIRLDLSTPIRDETIASLNAENYVMGGIRFIRTPKNADSIPPDVPAIFIVDYEAVKAENSAFYDAVRAGKRGNDLPPKPLVWDVLRTINPKALPGWINVLSDWWHMRPHQAGVVRLLLDVYSELPNPLDAAADHWKALNKEHGWGVKESATCQQFFNPSQGKGQNRSKADAVSVGNMSSFWLTEFLKMVGFYHDAITRTVAGGKDRKIFVVAPLDMSFAQHDAILSRFKPTITSEASTRFDILASLRYSKVLLDYYTEAEDDNLLAALLGVNIQQNLVAGFRTAFYMDLGQAVATMNVSAIALPGWLMVQTPDDANLYKGILDELITFTRQFEEKNSDAFALLQHLRDFVSGDDLSALFRLTSAFPSYYMGMRERGKYAQQLTTTILERIISMTDPKLTPILESTGFQNIAYAIRHSTVIPQYRKASGDRLYEIRYGLGQDLTRVARKGKEMQFISALSDFIHLYNAENARIYEVRKVQYRKNVTTDDLNEITRLIDAYDAPTIARMLVAYGYARVPREDDAPDEPAPDDTPLEDEA